MKRVTVSFVVVGVLLIGGCYGPTVPPTAGFTCCPDGWRGQLDVQFTSASVPADRHWIVSYAWDFGDGETVDDFAGWVSHAYADEGTYEVRLTVTDDRGLEATSEREIVVLYPAVLEEIAVTPGSPSRAVGTVENRSSYVLDSVTIQVKFYDADQVRIGESSVNVSRIDPGERVRFIAEGPSYPDVVTSARSEIQSYVAECSGSLPSPIPLDDGGS